MVGAEEHAAVVEAKADAKRHDEVVDTMAGAEEFVVNIEAEEGAEEFTAAVETEADAYALPGVEDEAGAVDGIAVAKADAHAEEPTLRAPWARLMVEPTQCSQGVLSPWVRPSVEHLAGG
jgi:hypothetical protein